MIQLPLSTSPPSSHRPARIVRLMGFCLAIWSLYGCEDVQLNWQAPQAAVRPVGPPVGRQPDQDAQSAVMASSHPPRPALAKASTRQTSADMPALLSLHQLVLLSEPGPAEAPVGFHHVRLNYAKARDVANILKVCYVPSGPSGTDHRYTLVYPTPLEQSQAAQAAAILDVPRITGELGDDTAVSKLWHYYITEAFAVLNQPIGSAVRAQRLARQFMEVIPSAELSRLQRWMAAMLAGELLTNLAYDFAAADRAYQQAQQIAEPGSYEQMSALYARGKAYVQDGQRDEAKQVCEFVIGQFGALRGCEAYARARDVLAAYDKLDRR